MPDRAHTITLDPELQPGARNAIRDCLRLKPEERITIITDEATRDIAAALQTEVEDVGAQHSVFVLEEHADRPLTDMPAVILEDLAESQVSIFCAQTQRGEVIVDPAAVCVDEKTLIGSYSASVDLQGDSVQFVMNREMDLERLISHRFPLQESARALELAAHPQPASMKIVIQPGASSKD